MGAFLTFLAWGSTFSTGARFMTFLTGVAFLVVEEDFLIGDTFLMVSLLEEVFTV